MEREIRNACPGRINTERGNDKDMNTYTNIEAKREINTKTEKNKPKYESNPKHKNVNTPGDGCVWLSRICT